MSRNSTPTGKHATPLNKSGGKTQRRTPRPESSMRVTASALHEVASLARELAHFLKEHDELPTDDWPHQGYARGLTFVGVCKYLDALLGHPLMQEPPPHALFIEPMELGLLRSAVRSLWRSLERQGWTLTPGAPGTGNRATGTLKGCRFTTPDFIKQLKRKADAAAKAAAALQSREMRDSPAAEPLAMDLREPTTRPLEQTDRASRAIAFLLDQDRKGKKPTVKEVAALVGCSRASLYRDQQFKVALDAMKKKRCGAEPPRGHKSEEDGFDAYYEPDKPRKY
jgi:hypothetical protein